MACLSALAFPVATLASGSCLFAPGALVSFALAGGAVAAEAEWTWDNPGGLNWAETPENTTTGGNQNNPTELDLENNTSSAYKVAGGSPHYRITGGADESTLVLDHSGGHGVAINLYFNRSNVAHLWLTDALGNNNGNGNSYIIDNTQDLSALQNIFISKSALQFSTQGDYTLSANFVLGEKGALKNGTDATNAGIWDAGLYIQNANVVTDGYLWVDEANGIAFKTDSSSLSVSDLRGDGNLNISTVDAASSGAKLILRNGGSSYRGVLTFSENVVNTDKRMTLLLGDSAVSENVVLQVAGLAGTGGADINLANGAGSTTATIRIIGAEDTNSASYITFGENVQLSLDRGARQTFIDSSFSAGVTLAEDSSLTLEDSILGGGITFGQGSHVSLSCTSSISGDLTLNGNATLSLEYTAGMGLVFDSVNANGNQLTLTLSNFADLQLGTYDLFTSGYDSSVFRLNMVQGHKTASINAQGQLVVDAADMLWNRTNGTWVDEADLLDGDVEGNGWLLGSSANWFTNGDNVTFDHTTGGIMTLSGTIITNDLTIAHGDWTFDTSAADSSLSVDGTLNTGAHAITLQGGEFSISSLTGSGTIDYSGTSLTIGDASGFTGTLRLSSDLTLNGDLSFNGTLDTGTRNLTLQGGAFNIASLTGSGTINYSGTSLTITDGSFFTGDIRVGAAWTISRDLTLGDAGRISVSSTGQLTIGAGVTLTGNLYLDRAGTNSDSDAAIHFGAGSVLEGSITLTGNTRFETGSGVIINSSLDAGGFDLQAVRTGVITINGEVTNLKTIKVKNAKFLITSDLTANSLHSSANGTLTLGKDTNGGFNGMMEFSGSVSGITHFVNEDDRGGANFGDDSKGIKFSGSLTLDEGTTFSGAGGFIISGSLLGSGNLVKQGSGLLDIQNGTNFSGFSGGLNLSEGTVEVNGDARFGGVTMSGGTLRVAAGKNLTLVKGGQFNVTGGTTTFGEGAALHVQVIQNNYGNTDNSETGYHALLTSDSLATVLGGVNIVLDWDLAAANSSLYLIDSESLTDDQKDNLLGKITIAGAVGTLGLSIDNNGWLSVTSESYNLVWTDGDGTWSTDNGNSQWKANGSFVGGPESTEDVIFGESSESSGSIVIDQTVYNSSIRSLTIKGQFDFSFIPDDMYQSGGVETEIITIDDGANLRVMGDGLMVVSISTMQLVLNGELELCSSNVYVNGPGYDFIGITGTNPNAKLVLNYETGEAGITPEFRFGDYAGSLEIKCGTFCVDSVAEDIGGKFIVSESGRMQIGKVASSAGQLLDAMVKPIELGRTVDGAAMEILREDFALNCTIDLLTDTTIIGKAGTQLNGAVSGNGHALTLTTGSFIVGEEGSVSGVSTLTLGDRVIFTSNADGTSIEALSGGGTVTGGTLTISKGGSEDATTSSATISANLVKSGAGKQTLSGDINNGSITVNGGTLTLSGGTVISDNIEVSRGATLESAKSWTASNTAGQTLTLNNGTFKNTKTADADGQAVALGMGILSVGSGGGTIAWADDANALGMQQMSFTRLTGGGNLTVHEMKRTSNTRYQRLVIGEIYNYNGTLTVSVAEGGSASGYGSGGLYIGSAHQELGNNAIIQGIATVRNSTIFTKKGDGTLHIDTLKVYGESALSVSYDGGLFSVGTLELRADAVLSYDFSKNGLLTWDISALDGLGNDELTLNIAKYEKDEWYDLGITDKNGTHGDISALKEKISLNIDGEYNLLWRNGRLHLMLGDYKPNENQWDKNWGDVAELGPTIGTMLEHIYENGGDLVLSGTNHDVGNRNIVRITRGEGDVVIGGARYTQEENIGKLVDKSTWISMLQDKDATARYHILVGGSSCEATSSQPATTADAAGGFIGNSHIQMKGGEVDYIVGGNHVTNSAFTFTGSSWISIMQGSVVNGGIVGGSTLTKGSANDNTIYEFGGSQDAASHIYIYEALANSTTTPDIKLGDDTGAAFTAVVGGNAWVQLPDGGAEGMAPSFYADSNITIDLRDAKTHRFDKDIVGGNYTAFTGEGNANRSTVFTGESRITITANDQDVFTGGINGASRRASGGGGETLFEGNTHVTINGGTYQNIVAGGMWFEGTASGNHTSTLHNDGDTNVTIDSGNMWRVVGGSVSLQGGEGSSETQEGNSSVTINGGSFTSKGLDSQTQIGFVSGGDFYRNNSGHHEHDGDASVIVNAGSFTGVHIVGGDYANASAPTGKTTNTMSTKINGTSSVTLGGAGSTGELNVTGLVVGGSYLTDSGAGGTVEVGSTAVSIGDRAVLDSHDGHTMHEGLAVVGGHVVIDENATSATTSGGHKAIVDAKTTLTVGGTAKITGDVVGGSYANRAAGKNTLNSKDIEITISGGEITGNVYGGHYTESVNSPDDLSTGNISITLTGGEVTGNIVGGGRRATVNDKDGTSSQGAITVSLTGGKLTGNVYAAGYNAGTGTGEALTGTKSTKVIIGAGVSFAAGEQDALMEAGSILISGGYGRADVGVARGTIDGDAVLEITGANTSIAANADKITFANFNVANVADGADTAVGTKLYVLRKQGTGAEQNFIKTGAGRLSVDGLTMWNAADDGTLRTDGYSGQITLKGGVLELTGADDQSLTGGLSYDLTTLGKNKAATTYLQATGDGKLTVGEDKVNVDITADDSVGVGFYFLAAGLDDSLAGMNVKELFDLHVDEENEKYSYELLMRDNRLILAVLDGENSDRWVWWGMDSDEWREDDSESWNQKTGEPHEQDVIFNGHGDEGVTIIGKVSPRSVWVQNGEYEFKGEEGGLNLGELGTELGNERYQGELAVGYGEEGSHTAALKLSLKNTSIGQVTLLNNGILTLAHAEALPEATKIVFSGGVLGYDAEAEEHADISSRITTGGDDYIIRIRVGSTEMVQRAAAVEPNIQWGGADTTLGANSGIDSAVNKGIEKTGAGTLTLEWKDNGAEHRGTPTVKEGTLAYRVGATGASKFSGAAEVDAGARLIIAHAKGAAQGSIEVANSLTGEGTVSIGQSDEKGAYTVSGDNSAYAGTLELAGDSTGAGAVTVAGANALGGAGTTLALNGRDVVFADGTPADVAVKEIHVTAGSTSNIGGSKADAANKSIRLAAERVTGSGTLTNEAGGFAHTLEGDLSEYSGTVAAGAGSSWTLGTSGEVKATLSGEGDIIFAGAEDILLTGKATDKVSLQNKGTGLVTLANENTSSGSLSGNINLGTADTRATWAGTSLAEGSTLTLVNGSLTGQGGLSSKGAGAQLIVNAAEGATVNAGGTSGSMFDAITINARGHLEGVSGSIIAGNGEGQTKVSLVVDKMNLTPGDGEHMITFTGNGGSLTVADPTGEGFVLDFSTDAIVETIKTSMTGDSTVWLNIVENGELDISLGKYNKLMARDEDGNLNLLEALGFYVRQVRGGALALSGSAHEVYLVTADEHSDQHTVAEYGVLSSYKATVVDENQTLTLKLKAAPTKTDALDYEVGGALVNNLIGLEGSQLDVVNERTDGGRVKLALDNSARVITEEHPEYPELKGVNTTFKGSITGNEGVDVEKLGDGVLTIGSAGNEQSGLRLTDGDLKISAGGVVLQGAENTMGSLTLAYTKEGGQGLTLRGGETSIGSINAEGEYTDAAGETHMGGSISLEQGAHLKLTGASEVIDTIIRGDGHITIASGAELTMGSVGARVSQLSGVSVNVQSGGMLDLGNTQENALSGLSGGGTLKGHGAGVSLSGSGSFSGTLSGNGSLQIAQGASLALNGATANATAQGRGWRIANNGSLDIHVAANTEDLWLEELTLGSASTTTLTINSDGQKGMLAGGTLSVESGAKLIINTTGFNTPEDVLTVARMDGSNTNISLADVRLGDGVAFTHSQVSKVWFENGELKVSLTAREENMFIVPGQEKNARAGAALLWDLTDHNSEGWQYIVNHPTGDLAMLAEGITKAYHNEDYTSMNKSLAAAAGASTSVLSSALTQDVKRQLNAMRNRSVMTEPSNHAANNDQIQVHAWITAESSFHKLNADGLAPGFKLNGWGGSVGADIDLSDATTVGLAVSAMYSDLTTDAADNAKGDMDSTYLSAYSRTTHGAWTHTFAAAVGAADMTLNRTVTHELGSYRTHGSTSGEMLGFMYEVGYSIPLNENASTLVQPVFNLQYTYAKVSGYTEGGSDAALKVDGMEQTTLTLGAGARVQSVVGENSFNRVAIVEAHALLKADLGDRSGSATTGFMNAGGARCQVESAEVGALGLEIGAGLSVPISEHSGTIFMDASADFRAGYSNMNATAGYRISF